jgi:hypothetical protein
MCQCPAGPVRAIVPVIPDEHPGLCGIYNHETGSSRYCIQHPREPQVTGGSVSPKETENGDDDILVCKKPGKKGDQKIRPDAKIAITTNPETVTTRLPIIA